MARTPFVAGNWKLHHDRQATRTLVQLLLTEVGHSSRVEVAVGPTFTSLQTAVELTRGSALKVAAQNCWCEDKGAFTGEIAPSMLAELGVQYVILGHSERRAIFHEDDALINRKVKAALAAGLRVIFCVGETLEEREGNRTLQVVSQQVRLGLAGLATADMAAVTVAYEPVWAIGTGRTATPNQAQEVHAAIRGLLTDLFGASVANDTRILYGGSIKPDNASDLFGQPDIDGGLVGGASLKLDSFLPIVQAARHRSA